MCGRFTLTTDRRELAEWFQLALEIDFESRYNISPGQEIIAVMVDPESGNRVARLFHWGLVPFWADDPKIGNKMINVRAETVFDKPAFRMAIRKRRCLIPANGFYEWERRSGQPNQPHYFSTVREEPLALAGIWECWDKGDGEPLYSCAILTTGSNALIRSFHERMPVILERESHTSWLNPAIEKREDLEPLLRIYPSERLYSRPVSDRVNSPFNDCPEVLEPPEKI